MLIGNTNRGRKRSPDTQHFTYWEVRKALELEATRQKFQGKDWFFHIASGILSAGFQLTADDNWEYQRIKLAKEKKLNEKDQKDQSPLTEEINGIV